ncbi:probable protein phosphatase 2C T23F11.1 isoform X2 [Paramacrobiotus metropolitanus]|uniref:probable protein phosphatase 2C T23F11.1 isoform X2 n=1 Tax=Paramacrobiotus metropolitanus TaxID=2943436 RepID=UPI0024461B5A|nr:probable protein phosphatase 2C T23F11.1 isoform X2 [Paramacrobiotus metropolitanus]
MMGLKLSRHYPIVHQFDEDSIEEKNPYYMVFATGIQGWRPTMEDAHIVQLGAVGDDQQSAFFALFDGHGGPDIAQFAAANIQARVLQHPKLYENTCYALRHALLEIDKEAYALGNDSENPEKYHLIGCTAVVTLIKDKKLYCANIADSRAIASVSGHAIQLSIEHKPTDPVEYERVINHKGNMKGYVENGRINGNLAVPRAIGDFYYKNNMEGPPYDRIVCAWADITVRTLTDDWEFLVMACDGIWDVMTNAEVVEFVRNRFAQHLEPRRIAQDLLYTCLAPDTSMGGLGADNMTIEIIALLNGRSFDEFCEKCATEPAENCPPQMQFYDESFANRIGMNLKY